MLGEFREWSDFLAPETDELVAMPRRQLRALEDDAKRRLGAEIDRFCKANFDGMTAETLNRLYETIKAHRGIEIPLTTFETEFAPFRPRALRGAPRHATVVISLWGLQFWFPEDHLAKDLVLALTDAGVAMGSLDSHYKAQHRHHVEAKDEIADLIRRRYYAARSGLLTAFNLVECYLNSMAWDYLRGDAVDPGLSNRQRKLLEDTWGTKFRVKLLKYPEIVGGKPLPTEVKQNGEEFLHVVKPFRDSLVHPSPFEAPDHFGGYDKLRMVCRVDVDTLFLATAMMVQLVEQFQAHIGQGAATGAVPWLPNLRDALDEYNAGNPPEWRS
ncbi:MAG: hypothetical protein R6X02_20060 [Enhygromyxa sp.]